jgi:hypothetical protein
MVTPLKMFLKKLLKMNYLIGYQTGLAYALKDPFIKKRMKKEHDRIIDTLNNTLANI